MREKRDYGKHILYIEDDTLVVSLHGVITLAESKLFTAAVEEVMAKHGYYMVLSNLQESQGIEADARRYSAQWSVGKPVLGIAMYNERLLVHTLFMLLIKAANIIRRQTVPYAYFKTEPEARTWLAQLRKQHLQRREARPSAASAP